MGLSNPDAGMRQAGEALKLARQQQGLSIEALAMTLKVTPAKLEALEQGRFDLLPDANFARALAMTVCRYLKMDPAQVLAGLPAARAIPLTSDKPPLNQPFKDFHATGPLFDRHSGMDWSKVLKLKWLAPALLLLAAVVVYLMPEPMNWPAWWPGKSLATGEVVVSPAAASAASAVGLPAEPLSVSVASEPVSSGVPLGASDGMGAVPAPVPSAVASSVQAGSAASAATSGSPPALAVAGQALEAGFSAAQLVPPEQGAPVQLRAEKASWVEVRDGKGEKILSRHMADGESLSLDGVPPLKLRIGNAAHVQLSFRGQPVDLSSSTRNNVARLELK
jgi:cytoskeleton protein RodZ